MKKQTITITTRASDGAMGIKINGRAVVTITKSGKKARIVGRNLKPIPRGTHRGANRFQFDLWAQSGRQEEATKLGRRRRWQVSES